MPGLHDFDVPGYVRHAFDVPVLVDKDVNIMALGEQRTHWPNHDNLLFIKAATGIGAGIISNGQLQRGAMGSPGDLGHIRVARGSHVICRCGNIGCLEALAGGPAIAATLTAGGAEMRTGDLIALVERGNPDAVAAIRQAGRDLGEVLATCVSLLNPSVIVLGGSLAAAGDHLLAGVREVVYNRSLPLATAHHCTVSVSRRRRHPRCLDAGRAACALRRCDRDRAGAAGLTLYLTLHRKPDSTQPPARATRAEFCRSNAGKMSVTAVGHRRGQCLGRQ